MANVQNTPVARESNGYWKKGASGNPGGRKPSGKTLADALRKWVTNGRRKELLEALGALALGHYVQEVDKDGDARVYLKSPDVKAIALIFERLDGKPPQAVEFKGDLPGLLVGRMSDEEIRELFARTVSRG
jgi:hypothetical protein